jgi:hypothetical protein
MHGLLINYLFVCFEGGREDVDKRRQENGQTWLFLSFKLPSWGMYLKKSTHPFLGAWSTFGLYLLRGPKAF